MMKPFILETQSIRHYLTNAKTIAETIMFACCSNLHWKSIFINYLQQIFLPMIALAFVTYLWMDWEQFLNQEQTTIAEKLSLGLKTLSAIFTIISIALRLSNVALAAAPYCSLIGFAFGIVNFFANFLRSYSKIQDKTLTQDEQISLQQQQAKELLLMANLNLFFCAVLFTSLLPSFPLLATAFSLSASSSALLHTVWNNSTSTFKQSVKSQFGLDKTGYGRFWKTPQHSLAKDEDELDPRCFHENLVVT